MSEDTTYKMVSGVRFLLKQEMVEGDHAGLEEWVYSCTICGRYLSSRGSASSHTKVHNE